MVLVQYDTQHKNLMSYNFIFMSCHIFFSIFAFQNLKGFFNFNDKETNENLDDEPEQETRY